MLKVKKTTYGTKPKNNELTKQTAEIKQAIKKIEEEKNKKSKTISDYAELIQSINKEYQKLALENDLLKKKLEKLEDKQLTTDFINHHRKQQEVFGGKRKTHHTSGDTKSDYFIPTKRKTKQKTTKKYEIYYDDEDDDLNDDVDGALESNEEGHNFDNDDEDDNDVTYEKKTNSKTNKKTKKKGISNYLNK